MNWREYLADAEASTRGVFVPRTFIEVAGDSLLSGLALAQIVYWHSPGADGRIRLRVKAIHPIDGDLRYVWAQSYPDWHKNVGFKEAAITAALNRLEKLGLVALDVLRFNASPTKHIWLNRDLFAQRFHDVRQKRMQEILDRGRSEQDRLDERASLAEKFPKLDI